MANREIYKGVDIPDVGFFKELEMRKHNVKPMPVSDEVRYNLGGTMQRDLEAIEETDSKSRLFTWIPRE